jgi:hypothetical protein
MRKHFAYQFGNNFILLLVAGNGAGNGKLVDQCTRSADLDIADYTQSNLYPVARQMPIEDCFVQFD